MPVEYIKDEKTTVDPKQIDRMKEISRKLEDVFVRERVDIGTATSAVFDLLQKAIANLIDDDKNYERAAKNRDLLRAGLEKIINERLRADSIPGSLRSH